MNLSLPKYKQVRNLPTPTLFQNKKAAPKYVENQVKPKRSILQKALILVAIFTIAMVIANVVTEFTCSYDDCEESLMTPGNTLPDDHGNAHELPIMAGHSEIPTKNAISKSPFETTNAQQSEKYALHGSAEPCTHQSHKENTGNDERLANVRAHLAMQKFGKVWPAKYQSRVHPHHHFNPEDGYNRRKYGLDGLHSTIKRLTQRLSRMSNRALLLRSGAQIIPFRSRYSRSKMSENENGAIEYTGPGTVIDPRGSPLAGTYTGQIVRNQKHGNGRLIIHESQSLYVGHFENNMRHGSGRLYHLSPETGVETLYFVGIFRNDHAVFGKAYEESGEIYFGHWNLGNYHGKGQLTRANGEIVEGFFHNGMLVEQSILRD